MNAPTRTAGGPRLADTESARAGHRIWFDRPASNWNEALPLGNGRLGAMVFGHPTQERFQINDGTAWSGSPESEHAPPHIDRTTAARAIAESRRAIRESDFTGAGETLRLMQHRYSQSFLPFSDLHIAVRSPTGPSEVTGYRRTLDLDTATHTTRYLLDGRSVVQRAYASHPAGALVIEIEAQHPDGLDVDLALTSQLRVIARHDDVDGLGLTLQLPADVTPRHDGFDEPVTYSDRVGAALVGAVVVSVEHDGAGTAQTISGARRVRIVLATRTTFDGMGRMPAGSVDDALAAARATARRTIARDADEVAREHRDDHAALYGRVELTLGEGRDELPTDRRLGGNVPADDPAMAALLFHYGRYLLIACSRSGGVPANLQGIWNDELQPAWSSNYTTNINLQMNYWLAEVGNLAECLDPLFDLIDALTRTGGETARRLYGAHGWVAHHNTDIWAYSQPVGLGNHDPKWSFWPMAGAWLVRHLGARLTYGADDDFARDRAWGPIRGAAEFYLDWLLEQPDGTLGTSPSTSPENQFLTQDGTVASVGRSSTNDLVVIADLFDLLVTLAARLGRDDDAVVRAAAAARHRLPGPRIGRGGEIVEWSDDFEAHDPTHRHLSHLYFVHPAGWDLSDELRDAARASMDSRGDESTGWSLAWKLALRARLGEPEKVSDLLRLIFRDMQQDRGPWVGGLYPNLLSAHPPFSIDGNLGFVAGLAECLMQDRSGIVELLPCVPVELGSGAVRGLVAPGGIEIDLAWDSRGGRVTLRSARVTNRRDRPATLTLRYGGRSVDTRVAAGAAVALSADDFSLRGVNA